jgi:hypothetical protein
MAGYSAACGWSKSDISDVYGAGTASRTGPEGWNLEAANAVTMPAIVNFAGLIPCISVGNTPFNRPLNGNNADMTAITSGSQDAFYQGILTPWIGWPTKIYLRIGYEWNLGTTQYGIDYAGTMLPLWIPMYQHIYTVLKNYATANGITLVQIWNPSQANNSNMGYDFRAAYPGNAFVDAIGLDTYEAVECTDTSAVYTNPVPHSIGAMHLSDLGAMVSGGTQYTSPGYASLAPGSATMLAGGTTWVADTQGLLNIFTGTSSTGASAADLLYHYADWPDASQYHGPTGSSMQAAGGPTSTVGSATSVGMIDMIHWTQYVNTANVGQGGVVGATGAASRTDIEFCFPEFGNWVAGFFVSATGTYVADQSNNDWTNAVTLGATGVLDGIYIQSYQAPYTAVNTAAEPHGTNWPGYMQSRIAYAQSLGINVSMAIWFVAAPNAWLAIRPALGAKVAQIGWTI